MVNPTILNYPFCEYKEIHTKLTLFHPIKHQRDEQIIFVHRVDI